MIEILGRKSAKNGIWMYFLQFFDAVVPLFTLPYITRILGKEGYGVFSVALNMILYLQVVVEYGFGMSATRKTTLICAGSGTKPADAKEPGHCCDKERKPKSVFEPGDGKLLNRLFTSVWISKGLLFAGCSMFLGIYCWICRAEAERCVCMAVLMPCLLGSCFQVNWLFQGLQDMKFISLTNIAARTISVICIFSFVHRKSDLVLYCVLYAGSPLLSGILGFLVSAVKYRIRFVKVSLHDVVQELRDGFYVFSTQLSAKVFAAVGITFLGMFAPYSEVGMFSAIQKITNIMILAWTPITQVLYPVSSGRVSEDFVSGKEFVFRIRRYILPVFAALALMVALIARPLIGVMFGAEYAEHYYWIYPLLLWLIIAINNNFTGIQILLGGGYDREYSKCFQIGVVCTLLLTFILTFLFHGAGASAAPALSELILGILLAGQIRKIEREQCVEGKVI